MSFLECNEENQANLDIIKINCAKNAIIFYFFHVIAKRNWIISEILERRKKSVNKIIRSWKSKLNL